MKISVLIPSYSRPESLDTCLTALAAQDRAPGEVIVITRSDDRDTRALVSQRQRDGLNVREEVVTIPGQVGALIAGVRAASGDVLAMTDDDAAPRSDWISGLWRWFEQDEVVGAGGRDAIPAHEPDRPDIPVGRVRWFGKVVGNHHLGTGPPQDVDILKGVNMAFRRDAVREHGFDRRLRGNGAQVHNDLKLCLALRGAGGRLIYDPSLIVDHFPAVRPSGDLRSNPASAHQIDAVHNETLALLEFLPPARRAVFLVWAVAVGRRSAPGVAHTVWTITRRKDRSVLGQLAATMRGRWAGWRTYRRSLVS